MLLWYKVRSGAISVLDTDLYKYVEFICRNDSIYDHKYSISPEVKEALIKSLGYIEDKTERAECTIAFLSL